MWCMPRRALWDAGTGATYQSESTNAEVSSTGADDAGSRAVITTDSRSTLCTRNTAVIDRGCAECAETTHLYTHRGVNDLPPHHRAQQRRAHFKHILLNPQLAVVDKPPRHIYHCIVSSAVMPLHPGEEREQRSQRKFPHA